MTIENTVFLSVMTWVVSGIFGGTSRLGPCCFMNQISLVLNRNQHTNAKYMLHPDPNQARASNEFPVCLQEFFFITNRHRFGLH